MVAKIPEAPNVWDEIFANLKKSETLYKGKRKLYKRLDVAFKVTGIIALLAFSVASFVFIRAFWVCGF